MFYFARTYGKYIVGNENSQEKTKSLPSLICAKQKWRRIVDTKELLSMIDTESRPSKTKSKKRKWREIEAIHDRYRLRKELEDMDMSLESELANL
ncbi:hypothetical protein GCM10009114_15120 [Aliiglaciecola litoralis]|uniref:DUF3545 family protein n=1 Tax=Aliiglaciecola litoralis TaxID=582857 RepID=A0ABN1LHA6_9ALTE